MKKLLALILASVVSMVSAQQTQTTGNVLNSTSWAGVTNGTLPTNRMPGSVLLYDTATGTINWSYNTATASKTIAINNALSGTGIQVNGYNYSYDLRNMNGDDRQTSANDTMTVTTKMTSNTGATLLSSSATHNTKFDWTTFSGTQTSQTPYGLGNLGNLNISFTSRDVGFWSGYFGPEVKNVSMSLNYTVDPCISNPLYSSSCPGWQAEMDRLAALEAARLAAIEAARIEEARLAAIREAERLAAMEAARIEAERQAFLQNCSANVFFSVNCPGYQDAYNKKIALETVNKQSTTTTQSTTISPDNNLVTSSNPSLVSIGDSTVVSVVSTPSTTSTTSPTSVISVINKQNDSVTNSAVSAVISTSPVSEAKQQEQKQEQKKTETQVARAVAKSNASQAAKEASESAKNATTLEAQAATQGLVVGLMGYVPGFSAYQNAIVPDILANSMARQYHKPTVDNRNAQRRLSGASDRTWQEMVDSQYKIGN